MNRRTFLQASAGAAAMAGMDAAQPEQPAAAEPHPSGLCLVEYHHEIVEGAPYDAGKAQADNLKRAGWRALSYDHPRGAEGASDDLLLIERHCPAVLDEMRGVADGLGIGIGRVLCCGAAAPPERRCAHFALLPSLTRDHRIRAARSYELVLGQADLRLVAARVIGSQHHLGFSEMIVGRNDGLNAAGLWMSFAGSGGVQLGPEDAVRGLPYSLALRSTLDTCRDVSSALAHLEALPIDANASFILADRSGRAAVVEIAGRRREVKRIDARSADQHLLSVNHYQLIKPAAGNENSATRQRAAEDWIASSRGNMDTASVRGFLDRIYPHGFCGFIPEARLGTLWSVAAEPVEGALEVRFGPPPHNGWRRFTLEGKPGCTRYWALMPAPPAG